MWLIALMCAGVNVRRPNTNHMVVLLSSHRAGRYCSKTKSAFWNTPMPPAEEPRNRALWVAALINPLPALGVSLEIRPAVLSAPTTAAALEAVMHGIKTSIAHLDGSEPMW